MTCQGRHATCERGHQPLSQKMKLGRNMDMSLSTLHTLAAGQAIVYCYVIASMRIREGKFVQTGCGPNFEGGLITLCTCKHRMRTAIDIEDWPDAWIAGFTGSSAGEAANFLVYLMQVEHAFASHRDLWFSTALSSETKRAK